MGGGANLGGRGTYKAAIKALVMKKHVFSPGLALALPMAVLLWTGCSKEQEIEELLPATTFTFDYPALPITIDSATVAGPGLVFALDSTTLAQAAQAHQYVPGQITALELTKARLHFASPANSFYNSIASVKLFLQADETSVVQVASLNPVPNGAQTLLLKLSPVDVLQLMRSSQARMILRMEFDGPMPTTTGHVVALGARATVDL